MDMHPTGGSPAFAAAGSGLGVAGADEERLREEYQNDDDDDCLVLRPMVDVVAATSSYVDGGKACEEGEPIC